MAFPTSTNLRSALIVAAAVAVIGGGTALARPATGSESARTPVRGQAQYESTAAGAVDTEGDQNEGAAAEKGEQGEDKAGDKQGEDKAGEKAGDKTGAQAEDQAGDQHDGPQNDAAGPEKD